MALATFGFPPAYIGILFSMLYTSSKMPHTFWGANARLLLVGLVVVGIVAMLPLYTVAMDKGSEMDRNK